ncbi:MAG: hypothetical protein IJ153_04190 [Clostridia bacterium]|nr:hypothetical protein [Clostridia bacterium]
MIKIETDLQSEKVYFEADFTDNVVAEDFVTECGTELRLAIISAIIAATDECIQQCGPVEFQGEEQVEGIKKFMIETAQSITAEDIDLIRRGMSDLGESDDLGDAKIIQFPKS